MITNTNIFIFITGMLTIPVIMGFMAWVFDLKLRMTWWKWLLTALWYGLFIFFVFLDFTIIGEGERDAGLKMLAFETVIIIILGTGLLRLLFKGRRTG